MNEWWKIAFNLQQKDGLFVVQFLGGCIGYQAIMINYNQGHL